MRNYYSFGQIEQDPRAGILDIYAAPIAPRTVAPTAVLDAAAMRRLSQIKYAPGTPAPTTPAAPTAPVAPGAGKALPIALGALAALMLLR